MHDHAHTERLDGPRGDVLQRNIWWTMLLTRLMMRNDDLRQEFPQTCDVILLPDGDDELVRHNLGLYQAARSDRPTVLVHIGIRGSIVDVQPLDARPRRAYALA